MFFRAVSKMDEIQGADKQDLENKVKSWTAGLSEEGENIPKGYVSCMWGV